MTWLIESLVWRMPLVRLHSDEDDLIRIFHKDLGLKAFKMHLIYELRPDSLGLQHVYSEWNLHQLEKKSLCYHEIVFSGEAQFSLNGYVNKQNCSILIDDQPEECQELPVQYQYPRNNGVIKKSCS